MLRLPVAAALLIASVSPARAGDPPVLHLWENGAPGFEARKDEKEVRDRQNPAGEYRLTNVHNPYVTVFLPPFILVGDIDHAATWLLDHFSALRKAGVSCELHVYAKAPHGFGFRPNKTTRPVDAWPQRFHEFLGTQGMLKAD